MRSNKIQEYRYRPPLQYLLLGLAISFLAVIFGLAIPLNDGLVASLLLGLLCLLCIITGGGVLMLFLKKISSGNLIIGQGFIEIPGRWKKRTRITFKEIEDIRVFNTYGQVLEIETKKGVHLIEEKWMKKSAFEKVYKQLMALLMNDARN